VRRFSLIAAQGIYPGDSNGFKFINNLNRKIGYLKNTYFPVIYPVHTLEPKGFYTIHPVIKGSVDEIKDVNYYQFTRNIYTKMIEFVDRCKIQIYILLNNNNSNNNTNHFKINLIILNIYKFYLI